MGSVDDSSTQANGDSSTPPSDGKVKRASRGKGKAAKADQGKRSLNLSLPVDVYERLVIHAMRMTDGNLSELVTRLANEHLREFHVARTGRSGQAGDVS